MEHAKDKGGERKLPEYHFDYCFPGDEMGYKWTVLVGKEKMSKSWFATAVPQKGASGRFATDKCLAFMKESGDGGHQCHSPNSSLTVGVLADLVENRWCGCHSRRARGRSKKR